MRLTKQDLDGYKIRQTDGVELPYFASSQDRDDALVRWDAWAKENLAHNEKANTSAEEVPAK